MTPLTLGTEEVVKIDHMIGITAFELGEMGWR